MIGIEIKYNNQQGFLLRDLLNGINHAEYDWYIEQSEIIYDNNSDVKNINNTCINWDEFEKMISKESYYVYFVNIHAYNKGKAKMQIINYTDFINSNCELVILISDGWLIEIYSKDIDKLNRIIKNANEIKVEEIIMKTKDNDERRELFV